MVAHGTSWYQVIAYVTEIIPAELISFQAVMDETRCLLISYLVVSEMFAIVTTFNVVK